MIGKTISHYRIRDKLGEGGMGVVYRAHDTKLNREVAIKFLSAPLAHDRDRMVRFRREAQLLAQLNHANIAAIYGVEESAGQYALVMELAGGATLADRLTGGAIPVDEALSIAKQIVDALEAAHEKGIIHRDLKPANIKLSDDGNVKVLDFGLAKALEGDTGTSTATENSPTLTMAATQAGVIMGTAGYMSPEQARGKSADKRGDIWSFGVVLYEMLTGQQLFSGETVSDSLAGVLRADIDFSKLPADTPPATRKLLRRCLERDQKRRLQAIGDARLEIEEVAAAEIEDTQEQSTAAPRRLLPWVLFAATAVALLAVSFLHFRKSPPGAPEAPLRRFSITPPVPLSTQINREGVAISPNGWHIAFATRGAEGKLWIQDLDRDQSRAIEGSEGAGVPFWSPDSEFIGFVADGELKKISAQGGPAIRVCQIPGPVFFGGSWSADGDSIVFGSGFPSNLYEVPARGGSASLLISREASKQFSTGRVRPSFMPSEAGARVVVFVFGSRTEPAMMIQDLETGRRELLGAGYSPSYSPSGHIVYQSSYSTHDLWALPFSLDTLKATGAAFPIAQNAMHPSVAVDGTLVYFGGAGREQQQLVWRDRSGQRLGVIGQPQDQITYPVLSPDGRRVAVTGEENGNLNIWVHDVTRAVKSRLTFGSVIGLFPTWSPSGDEIAFSRNPEGNFDGFSRAADGSGEPMPLVATPLSEYPGDWSRDGKYLVYSVQAPKTGLDLWYLKRKEDGSGFDSIPFLQTSFSEQTPRLSTDDRFIAYISDESGRQEIHVRPFPEGRGRWQVSTNGGTQPRWSNDGKELFYVEGATLMAVRVTTTPGFTVGSGTPLFEDSSLAAPTGPPQYDAAADGQRFVMAETLGAGEDNPLAIRVVQNWYEEFRDRQ